MRVLAVEAQADYDAGRFAEAGRKFQQALTVLEVPTLSVWAARSLVKTGKLLRATELYRRALKLTRNDNWVGAGQEHVQQEANQELEALVARLAHLQVVLSDPPEGIGVIDPGKRTLSSVGTENRRRRRSCLLKGTRSVWY